MRANLIQMKTVINLWHTGIAGTRLAHRFSERTRLLHDDDATELDDAEEVAWVVALATTKECKSLRRQQWAGSKPARKNANIDIELRS